MWVERLHYKHYSSSAVKAAVLQHKGTGTILIAAFKL